MPPECPPPENSNDISFKSDDGKSCYLLVVSSDASWNDAEILCKSRLPGSDLAMIGDLSEHKNVLINLSNNESHTSGGRVWIGGLRTPGDWTDPKDPGSWIWAFGEPWTIPPCNGLDDACKIPGEFWATNNKNVVMPDASYQQCVQYVVNKDWPTKGLNDYPCWNKQSFLCELKQ